MPSYFMQGQYRNVLFMLLGEGGGGGGHLLAFGLSGGGGVFKRRWLIK